MPDLIEVTIRWRGQVHSEVKLAGQFNDWTPETIEKQEDGTWSRSLKLAPGKYMYKFVVDGDWKVNDDLPSAVDEGGNRNNVLEVEEVDNDTGSGDSDSWEKVSIPETSGEDPMTTSVTAGANMQKISVIERVYSMPVSSEYESIASSNNGVLTSTVTTTSTYLDTEDCYLQRKAIWLEKLSSEDSTSWKLTIIDKDKLKVFDNLGEITEIIQEVLKDSNSTLEQIANNKLVEVSTKKLTTSKWTFGDTELEVRSEDGEVTSVLIREVGDVVSAVSSIEQWANKFRCSSYKPHLAGVM